MESRELKINIPDGYEIDRENSTFECIKFKPKHLTYNDVAEELFYHKNSFILEDTEIFPIFETTNYTGLVATSCKQLLKLIAINKLMNVAKYLNGGQESDIEEKQAWAFYIDDDNKVGVYRKTVNECPVYFKTQELAQQAIDILGESTIRLALSTDW